jgi:hypothetical protein
MSEDLIEMEKQVSEENSTPQPKFQVEQHVTLKITDNKLMDEVNEDGDSPLDLQK